MQKVFALTPTLKQNKTFYKQISLLPYLFSKSSKYQSQNNLGIQISSELPVDWWELFLPYLTTFLSPRLLQCIPIAQYYNYNHSSKEVQPLWPLPTSHHVVSCFCPATHTFLYLQCCSSPVHFAYSKVISFKKLFLICFTSRPQCLLHFCVL